MRVSFYVAIERDRAFWSKNFAFSIGFYPDKSLFWLTQNQQKALPEIDIDDIPF